MRLESLSPGTTATLPPVGTWPKTYHYYNPEHLVAVVAAWHAKRPLLVVGEPGVGKSQLARAVAQKIGGGFLPTIIKPGFRYQDLLWELDSVARLAEAQLMAAIEKLSSTESKQTTKDSDPRNRLKKENFVYPGPLWWAYRPVSANTQAEKTGSTNPVLGQRNSKNLVLLIDEIDKADADLPNGLLDIVAHGDLQLPVDAESETPQQVLTIITSNGDRPLPPAFVRRCLVLDMKLPEESSDALPEYLEHICGSRDWCVDKGSQSGISKDVREKCIELFIEARRKTAPSERKPSVAEFLDLVRVVLGVADTADEQLSKAAELQHLLLYKSL